MTDQQPATPPGPDKFRSILLLLLGIILLLPGLCSLYFAMAVNEYFFYNDVWPFILVWIAGLLIGAGGIALITLVMIRRGRRR